MKVYKKNSIGDLFCVDYSLKRFAQVEASGDIHLYDLSEIDEERFNRYPDTTEKDFADTFFGIWNKFLGEEEK